MLVLTKKWYLKSCCWKIFRIKSDIGGRGDNISYILKTCPCTLIPRSSRTITLVDYSYIIFSLKVFKIYVTHNGMTWISISPNIFLKTTKNNIKLSTQLCVSRSTIYKSKLGRKSCFSWKRLFLLSTKSNSF